MVHGVYICTDKLAVYEPFCWSISFTATVTSTNKELSSIFMHVIVGRSVFLSVAYQQDYTNSCE